MGSPAAGGQDDERSETVPASGEGGSALPARSATSGRPGAAGGGAAGTDPAPASDPGGGGAPRTAPGQEAAAPATAGARLARWLRTVPGLAASTVVTTLCAAAATALFTGALHLWPESSKVSLSVETDPLRIDAEDESVQLVPAGRFDGSEPEDGCAGFWDWARARGGVDEDRTRMQLTVSNRGSNTLLITGMRAEVVSRRSVGRVVEAGCRSQGEANVYSVTIDLDRSRPYAVYVKNGVSRPPDFTVAAGGLETFLVTAGITHGAAEWKLAVDLVEDGRKRTVVVDDGGGRPFTTVTAPAAVPRWELDPDGGGWHDRGRSASRSSGAS
ncbi:hypothetical protein GCM10018793_43080 [Streptomyces sulfonofaciens]|uniref:Uncharacterized protein n=1 Tax=Streptomyces sulfonofaciens TaxID=68272 RepID=A0A919GDP4_9ACTN|nr:hypothetical protein [Streptomyces sulfonofaciens]GHH82742.1 hypothetical protein GCM10018793_43080 [Streptomyces sulfonofaciens]